MEYTPSQQRAIDNRDQAILISAAAGSGKTAVLIQRIIERICADNGVDINQLLVVTFTNAAAAEMKDKIYKEIMERLQKNPNDKHLKRQLLLLSCAHIQTMHSFCLDVIKNHINLLDIPVQFRIADELEANVMKQKCLLELVEDQYEANNPKFLRFLDTYGYGRDDTKIYDLILRCYQFGATLANPEQYYEHCIRQAEAVCKDFTHTIFADLIINRLQEMLAEHIKTYRLLLDDMASHPDLLPYEELILDELKAMESLFSERDFLELQHRIHTFQFRPLTTVKGVKRGTDNTFLKTVRNQFKSDFEKFLPLMSNSVASEMADSAAILEGIETLISFTHEFAARYREEKKKKSCIDFSDFEHLAWKILTKEDGTPSEVAKSYQEQFCEILIDEYQDTNDIQDRLFHTISRNGENLFLVGDVKQSIYGFRHAKPQIFADKQESYHDATHEVILLSHNFRSRKEVVDAVNQVFIKTMTPKTGRTDYEKEALIQSASYRPSETSDYSAEILLFDKAKKMEYPDEEEAEDWSEEARMIVQRIHQLIRVEKTEVFDLKSQTFRPAGFGDIVILVRNMTSFSGRLYHTLVDFGIPVDADFSEDLFSSSEISVLSSILKAIDNPYDDLALLSLLKSPIFHWEEDAICTLRTTFPSEPLYSALEHADTKESKRVLHFLYQCRQIAYTKRLSDLIQTLYREYHIKELFCVYKNPEQRMENLDVFYHMVLRFEQTQTSGLKGLVNYMERCINSGKNIPSFREKPSDNAVRILTMHKSKGLEYPIVFVAGLGQSFNRDDSKKTFLFHPEYGIGADYVDEKHRFSYPTLTKKAMLVALRNEAIMEELRILYVAMTRAKEKLILTATLSNAEKRFSVWEGIRQIGEITKNRLYHASNFIDIIMPCVLGGESYRIHTFSMEELRQKPKDETPPPEEERDMLSYEHLFHTYHRQELTTLPSKVSVTEANRLHRSETPAAKIVLSDLDTLDTAYSQSEYGTYFHKVFECVDLDAIRQGVLIHTAVCDAIRLAGARDYSPDVEKKIEAFFETDIAKELLAADAVYRERAFLVRIPANQIYPVETEEPILLQGVTDCYFIKDDEITLLDFKTDRNPDEDHIRQNYQMQLELYAYALEKIEEKKVAHKYIYTAGNQRFLSCE